jgi:hypothetical protein
MVFARPRQLCSGYARLRRAYRFNLSMQRLARETFGAVPHFAGAELVIDFSWGLRHRLYAFMRSAH